MSTVVWRTARHTIPRAVRATITSISTILTLGTIHSIWARNAYIRTLELTFLSIGTVRTNYTISLVKIAFHVRTNTWASEFTITGVKSNITRRWGTLPWRSVTCIITTTINAGWFTHVTVPAGLTLSAQPLLVTAKALSRTFCKKCKKMYAFYLRGFIRQHLYFISISFMFGGHNIVTVLHLQTP